MLRRARKPGKIAKSRRLSYQRVYGHQLTSRRSEVAAIVGMEAFLRVGGMPKMFFFGLI
jgi:hypothetical protein